MACRHPGVLDAPFRVAARGVGLAFHSRPPCSGRAAPPRLLRSGCAASSRLLLCQRLDALSSCRLGGAECRFSAILHQGTYQRKRINHRFFEWRKFDENRHSAWRVPTVPEAGGLGVHFGCGPHWPQPAVFWKHMQDARRLTMCYACSLCNRCGRADEMKARFGKRRCPSCNAIATDNAARTCARCGATLPPPFPDPPASVPHRPA